jgi:hypothetical protein
MKLPLRYRGRLYEVQIEAVEDLNCLLQRVISTIDEALDTQSVTLVSASVKNGCKPMKTPDQLIQEAGVRVKPCHAW